MPLPPQIQIYEHICHVRAAIPAQLLCRENVDRKKKKRARVFYFKFGSMLVFLNSYYLAQHKNDTDVIFRSHEPRMALETGATINHNFLV